MHFPVLVILLELDVLLHVLNGINDASANRGALLSLFS